MQLPRTARLQLSYVVEVQGQSVSAEHDAEHASDPSRPP
jgi:hypothetical protein